MMLQKTLAVLSALCAVVNAHSYVGTGNSVLSEHEIADLRAHMSTETELSPEELELFYSHYGNFTHLLDADGHTILPPNHEYGPGWPIPEPMSAEFLEEITGGNDSTTSSLDRRAAKNTFPVIVQPVSFVNFIKKDGTGRNTYAAFQAQIDQLNAAYSAQDARGKYGDATDTRIRFKLAGVRYVVNDDYFNYCSLPTIIARSRPRYMMDGARHLNVYVCWCQLNLGLAWLPQDSWFRQNTGESHYALGTIVHHELLPGNNFRGGLWKKGNILTHEVGHCESNR